MLTLKMNQPQHAGRCLCGAVRYRLTGPVRHIGYCHCESCRRAAGASPVAWCTVDRECFEVTRGELRMYRSSQSVERGFCGKCGSTLTYGCDSLGHEIDVTLASLDNPAAFRPEFHIWVQDKLPWQKIDGDLPRHDSRRE